MNTETPNTQEQITESLKLKLLMSEAKLQFAINALRDIEVDDDIKKVESYAGRCADILCNPVGWVAPH